jgi:transcriptional regulator with XRE-family HTH domain
VTAIANRIHHIKDLGGISSREIAQLLDTTPQTVSRWQTGQSSPRPGALDQLLRLEWILDQLSQFYTPDEARLWIFSPHLDLEGGRPADAIRDGRTDLVLAVIDRLQSAAYS